MMSSDIVGCPPHQLILWGRGRGRGRGRGGCPTLLIQLPPHAQGRVLHARNRAAAEDQWEEEEVGVGRHSQLSSEVDPKMIFMGHEISSCHAPVVSSFFILFKTSVSSLNTCYVHLVKLELITLSCPKISPDFVKLASCTVPILTCTVQKLSCAVPIQT
jgi:hypothetical protein